MRVMSAASTLAVTRCYLTTNTSWVCNQKTMHKYTLMNDLSQKHDQNTSLQLLIDVQNFTCANAHAVI